MAAADKTGGDWPTALACVREACGVVQRRLDGSGVREDLYARAVAVWTRDRPEADGTSAALVLPQTLCAAGGNLPEATKPVRNAFTEAVKRARALAPREPREPPKPREAKELAARPPVSMASMLSSQVRAPDGRPPCSVVPDLT